MYEAMTRTTHTAISYRVGKNILSTLAQGCIESETVQAVIKVIKEEGGSIIKLAETRN